MTTKIAVVTGANKGIGFGIVKGLCARFPGIVYLTARNASKGEAAVNKLHELGCFPNFHQLDISDRQSVLRFKNYILATHGGIDLLINNAGVQFYKPYEEPLLAISEKTIRGNYGNLRDTCEDLFPAMRPNGRVINTSSGFGHLSMIPGENIRTALGNPNLTLRQLNNLVDDFINSVRKGTSVADGWGDDPYKVSKVVLTALTFVQQRYLARSTNIKVNAVNPGYVNTDMTRGQGILTVDQGAEPALYLALDAPDTVKGSLLWSNKQIVSWTGPFPEV